MKQSYIDSSFAFKLLVCFGALTSLLFANPVKQECPKEVTDLPEGTTCWGGQDQNGAYYWIVKPKDYNGNLVLHAHGGPALGDAKLSRATGDLKRWSIWARDGYGLAITSYRSGGVAVLRAAEDVANMLPIAVSVLGKPNKVILHGQSWGAGVAARAIEVDGSLSKVEPKVDAVILSSGLLAGGKKSYDFRLDLRVIWQYLCNNHPRPNEPQYPLWQGLASKDTPLMSKDDMSQRVNECLGLDKPESERSEKQKENIKTIVDVIKIPETSIQSHLTWATNHFQDIAFNRLDGKNTFNNNGVYYTGSKDDKTLNEKVIRYEYDKEALDKFNKDTNPTGNIDVPILTIRGIGDPTVFVEIADTWEETVKSAGKEQNMVQLYTDDKAHSYLSDAQYVASMNALLDWLDNGKKPTPTSVASDCSKLDEKWQPSKECRFLLDFKPEPLSSRVPVR